MSDKSELMDSSRQAKVDGTVGGSHALQLLNLRTPACIQGCMSIHAHITIIVVENQENQRRSVTILRNHLQSDIRALESPACCLLPGETVQEHTINHK